MGGVGGIVQRFLADGSNVNVFDRRVRELFGVVERGQLVEPVVGNFGDANVRFARIGVRLRRQMRLGQNTNSEVLPTWGRPIMPVFIEL